MPSFDIETKLVHATKLYHIGNLQLCAYPSAQLALLQWQRAFIATPSKLSSMIDFIRPWLFRQQARCALHNAYHCLWLLSAAGCPNSQQRAEVCRAFSIVVAVSFKHQRCSALTLHTCAFSTVTKVKWILRTIRQHDRQCQSLRQHLHILDMARAKTPQRHRITFGNLCIKSVVIKRRAPPPTGSAWPAILCSS